MLLTSWALSCLTASPKKHPKMEFRIPHPKKILGSINISIGNFLKRKKIQTLPKKFLLCQLQKLFLGSLSLSQLRRLKEALLKAKVVNAPSFTTYRKISSLS